uniref:PPIase cyclophilin-type domain-containing protein n=1 Tax=Chaetoceros debilis TaxID=122233 RepID=A0A7S3QJA2_9STRA
MLSPSLELLTSFLLISGTGAFSLQHSTRSVVKTRLFVEERNEADSSRRNFMKNAILPATMLSTLAIAPNANAVERAVGAAEKSCREAGNCLENFDLDGAVGWKWGGKDRCDATDPLCGSDGQMRDAPPQGEPVPTSECKVTNVLDIDIVIGKKEKGTLSVGLYGEACPASVAQMVDFLTGGIVTTSKLMLEDGYGVSTAPVSLKYGGALNVIYPQNRLDFGIVSQGLSYAKGYRLNKIPDDFVAQPRPNLDDISKEKSVRTHSIAGLISIPKNGIGYGGSGIESEDEAFASAFEITASNVPAMDREQRKVIGQLMNESSMQLLSRLASLPTKKGFKGIIPGQNAGPPLLKTNILNISSSPN